MLKALFTTFARQFSRNFSYSLITLVGLVVGITAAILTFVWVSYELSYNDTHPDKERVYALLINEDVEGEIVTGESMPARVYDLMQEVPEVEAVTRMDNSRSIFTVGNKTIQRRGVYADTAFFTIHPPRNLSGNRALPFPDNRSIAISQEVAQLLFGSTDVLGKVITLDHKNEFKVTAVYEPYPDNGNFNYIEFVLPYHSKNRSADDDWHNYDIKLHPGASAGAAEQKINEKFKASKPDESNTIILFGLSEWRLHWNFENGKSSGGRIVYVVIFSITAVFILTMACINYMNIATARAAKRAREIGVRKIAGATQPVLVRQFMLESMLMMLLAVGVSLLFIVVLLPLVNDMTGTSLSFSLRNPVLFGGLVGIMLFTGLLAGTYPAFLLSSFRPAVVLKGNLYSGVSGAGLRQALVVFQFALSVILIFCSVVMWQQTNYLLKKDLGYDKFNVINVWLEGDVRYPLDILKTEIQSHASVVSVAVGGASPMEINGWSEANRVTQPFPSPLSLYGVNIDEDFIPTLKFEIVEGRNFSKDLASDSSNFIITQKAAAALGFANPIGQKITYTMYGPQTGEIVGVIKDFHNEDIHAPVNPVVLAFGKPEYLRNVFVRYQPDKLDDVLAHVKKVLGKFQPGIPVNYSFLDRDFEDQFFRERLLGNLSACFTVIAIIIACLGLFGLTMFNAQRRTKEIGIRKVLGAPVVQMVVLLCRDFARPVVISFFIAFPIAYYAMEKFLEGYAFRTNIPISAFLVVIFGMAVLVALTVSYQSVHAAQRNPSDSLKTE